MDLWRAKPGLAEVSSLQRLGPPNTAEANVRGGAVFRLRMTSSRPVATAVVGRTEVGATLQHPPRDAKGRVSLIVAFFACCCPRIARYAAGLRRGFWMAGRPEIASPLPHVADHIVETIAVSREAADRRGAGKSVGKAIVYGK